MARSRDMALEVGVLVPESVRHVSGFTGTITELPSQAQTVYSPGGKVSVAGGRGRRSSLSESVGSAHPAIVTWGEFVRAPVSIPSFFVVIAIFSGTVWAQLTVAILDIVVA